MRRTLARFWLSEVKRLYQCSFKGPYLLCLHQSKTTELLAEHHEGICGGYRGGRSLAYRAITKGFLRPNMQRKAAKYIKKCDQCPRHAPILHQPGENLNPIISPWPFTQWGRYVIGPFSRAPRSKRYLVVATDYFIKWADAESLANIKDVEVKKFTWKNIITRFRVPCMLIFDNGL